MAVQGEEAAHEQQYRLLSKNMKGELDLLIREIRGMKNENPRLGARIEIIEKFLA